MSAYCKGSNINEVFCDSAVAFVDEVEVDFVNLYLSNIGGKRKMKDS